MYTLRQIAPFFNLETSELKSLLDEIDIVKKINKTTMGTYRITKEDIVIIENYLNIKKLFVDKKKSLNHLEIVLNDKNMLQREPEWLIKLKKENGYD